MILLDEAWVLVPQIKTDKMLPQIWKQSLILSTLDSFKVSPPLQ